MKPPNTSINNIIHTTHHKLPQTSINNITYTTHDRPPQTSVVDEDLGRWLKGVVGGEVSHQWSNVHGMRQKPGLEFIHVDETYGVKVMCVFGM